MKHITFAQNSLSYVRLSGAAYYGVSVQVGGAFGSAGGNQEFTKLAYRLVLLGSWFLKLCIHGYSYLALLCRGSCTG
jgi:hypothetical protein